MELGGSDWPRRQLEQRTQVIMRNCRDNLSVLFCTDVSILCSTTWHGCCSVPMVVPVERITGTGMFIGLVRRIWWRGTAYGGYAPLG
jgi:hypothetical protein